MSRTTATNLRMMTLALADSVPGFESVEVCPDSVIVWANGEGQRYARPKWLDGGRLLTPGSYSLDPISR